MSKRLDQLTAAILVGGLGTRLRTVVADKQKVVASVAGKPFLYRLLDQLTEAGIFRVVLCAGYHADQVRATIGESYRTLRIRYSVEPAPLGTAGAFRQALPLLESDPVLAMNGDSYCDVNLPAFFTAHHTDASLVVREVPDTSQSGRVTFDAAGHVTSFVEKGASQGPGWINAGIYLLSHQFIASVPAGRAVSIERETFPAWVGRGLRVHQTAGRFLDIGTPESYSTAQQLFA
jgi:NDP-sugar pyrophosphorylase family protein